MSSKKRDKIIPGAESGENVTVEIIWISINGQIYASGKSFEKITYNLSEKIKKKSRINQGNIKQIMENPKKNYLSLIKKSKKSRTDFFE